MRRVVGAAARCGWFPQSEFTPERLAVGISALAADPQNGAMASSMPECRLAARRSRTAGDLVVEVAGIWTSVIRQRESGTDPASQDPSFMVSSAHNSSIAPDKSSE